MQCFSKLINGKRDGGDKGGGGGGEGEEEEEEEEEEKKMRGKVGIEGKVVIT